MSIGFLLRNILTLRSEDQNGVHRNIFALFLRFNLSSSYDEVSGTETFLTAAVLDSTTVIEPLFKNVK